MLKLTDFGCNEHNGHQLTLSGIEAELMESILDNLPREGEFHTFICAHGNTHRLSFQFRAKNLKKLIKVPSRTAC